MRIERVNVVRTGAGETRAEWARALEGDWPDRAGTLKAERGSWVKRATLGGRDVVVKCRPVGALGERLKCALGQGRGDRHWRGAQRLRSVGVRTPNLHALARARVDGVESELLAMEALPGPTLLEVMDSVSRGASGLTVWHQHHLATAVGLLVASLRKHGLFNRDHKPSNLIVLGSPDRPDLAVLDCVAIRGGDRSEALRMLASLVIEPTGCGCRPRRALLMRAWKSAIGGKNGWHQIAAIIKEHGDPRPRTPPRPLGGP